MASETANSLNPVIRALLIGAVLIALVALPAFIDSYTLRVATGALMWAGLACAWNIVGGYAGYISFGHSAFFGIGAYTTAILMQSGIGASFFVTLLPAIALSIAVAVAIGGPTMRLRGAYFAIATWAFAEMLMQLVTVLDFTGGTAGLSLPAYLNEFFFYYVMLLAAAGSFLGVWLLIEHSRFGFRIKALRDDEPAAESL
ncbi:MAG: branched-chain amino acid ABC transporter permease, partial [Marinobacter sp.]|nr:branched-chain amino acid ABC transporter permease [Marinobacter sp.]